MSEAKIRRWIAEGRGSGSGAGYRPWLRVTDVPSRGFSHRVWSEVSGRIHHYLSFLEYKSHLWAVSMPDILDIREAFPLERVVTRELCQRFGIRHPAYPNSRIDTVMTTDLLLTLKSDRRARLLAWAVKPSNALASARVREKLFIERMYFQELGVEHQIVTERELPPILMRNLERIRFAMNLNMHPHFDQVEARRIQVLLLDYLPAHKDSSYHEFCSRMDSHLGLQSGDAHYLLSNLMGHWVLRFNLHVRWDVNTQMSKLWIDETAKHRHFEMRDEFHE